MSFLEGSLVAGRFLIEALARKGGMGEVFRARDMSTGAPVALKLLHADAERAEETERFLREARLVARLDHPGIVTIHDFGRQDGSLFFVMPLLRGAMYVAVVGVVVYDWRVLWPKPHAAPGNDASVVIDLDAAGYRLVLLGDLGEDAQERMLRATPVVAADLVKVAHHGSADQSERLYRELGSAVGLIGVGQENGYGHPTDRLLDVLRGAGTTAVRTDLSGTAVLTAEGDGVFRLWTERARADVGAEP